MVTHHGSSPRIDSPTSAVPVSALSAIGSAILPKSVTRPRRAGDVAVDPVGDHRDDEDAAARQDASSAARRRRRRAAASRRPAPGASRSDGQGVGDVPVARPARPAARLGRDTGAWRAVIGATRSGDQVDALGADDDGGARGRRPRRRRRAGTRRTVTPSTSGPWCAARPPRRAVLVVDLLDEHLDALADALLGPLGGELLDQAR